MKQVLILFALLIITSFAFADTTPPVTTFSSFQVPNTTDQNITLSCVDDNSECKSINYNVNNEGWNKIMMTSTFTKTFTNHDFANDPNITIKNNNTISCNNNWCLKNEASNSLGILRREDTNTPLLGLHTTSFQAAWNGNQGFTKIWNNNENLTGTFITFAYRFYKSQYDTNYGYVNDSNVFTSMGSLTPYNGTPTTLTYYIPAGTAKRFSLQMYASGSGVPYNKLMLGDINIIPIENPYSFIYSGAGSHSIQYFSTDNSDNNETTKTSNFTTYGNIRFNMYDENTGTALTGVTINNGTTDYSTGANYYYDFNLQGTTTQTKTYTISKTGYSTRTYTLDQNQFLDLNINFALLPTELSQEINFKFFKPDEITAYANIYIETKKGTLTLGRQKSNTLGEIKINLDQNATGITFDMNNGENTYQAVLLTINRPKSETTLIDIPENWGYEISGLASYIDSNVSTNTKVFAIYSNTVRSYSIQISSASITPKYAPRKYDVQIIGDQNTYTLQPYLIDNEVSVTTTIYTINAYTNQAISDVTIKIYRNLPVTGRTLIEQTITDAKGQSIVYLILNQTYSFEISIGETIIRTETYTITATSAGIWFKIDPGYVFETKPALNNVLAYWTPGKNWLGESDANISTKIEYQTAVSNTRTVSSVRITCDNDGNELFQDNFSNPTVPFTQTYDFNLITKTINSVNFDGNYPITCLTRITLNDGNVIEATQTYVVRNDSPQQNLGFNLRPVFGCTATNDPNVPCPSMIFFALLATMMLTAGIMIESGFTKPEFAGILFFVGLGFFTLFTWIPPSLYVVAIVIALLVYVALGVRRI